MMTCLSAFEVLLDVQPLESVTGRGQALVQLLSQHQRKNATKNMASIG
jgi:hypothetical protein